MKEGFIRKWSNWWIINKNKDVLDQAFRRELEEIIENERKEAYNQALEDAANHDNCDFVMEDEDGTICVSVEWIKKLKK